MEQKLAQPVAKGPRAVTLLSDMRRFLTEKSDDEDVKYWVACSYAGVTTSRTLLWIFLLFRVAFFLWWLHADALFLQRTRVILL